MGQKPLFSINFAFAVIGVILLVGTSASKCSGLNNNGQPNTAKGIVFEDINNNGIFDADEKGIAGVGVSNGTDVILTDANGRYELPVEDGTIIFVIKPAGWMTRTDEFRMPRFYYIYNPSGSPPLSYEGIAPTGKLPESIDFGLHKVNEPNRFDVLIFGDPQISKREELNYFCHDTIEEVIGINAAFGVTLGDITGEALHLMPYINQAISLIGINWYNIAGNHDMNFDANDDDYSLETYKSIYGPTYYSFNYGQVHFIMLDTIIAVKKENSNRLEYYEGLSDNQLEFVKNDLAFVDKDKLIVIMSHAGIHMLRKNQAELLKILEQYPYTLSVAGHQHETENLFLKTEQGWNGKEPHHIYVSGATCGAWWTGMPDEQGIPHSMMRNGVPKGYSIISFDGNRYSIRFKASRRSPDYQMRAYVPDEVDFDKTGETEVILNVFAGSERSRVEMKIDTDGQWQTMERQKCKDPYYELAVKTEEQYNFPRSDWSKSSEVSEHIWKAKLPQGLSKGAHILYFRTTDMFGQSYSCKKVLWVK